VQPVARELVALELARLDAWQVTLEARMDDGEPPERIVPVCLRVSERRDKLLGLDAPARAAAPSAASAQEAEVDVQLAALLAEVGRQRRGDDGEDGLHLVG